MARSSPEKLAAALRANLKRRKEGEAAPVPPQGAKDDSAPRLPDPSGNPSGASGARQNGKSGPAPR